MSRTRSIPLAQSARPIRNRASAPLARTSRRASRLRHARSASFLRVRRGSRPSRIPARRPRMLAPPAPSAQRKAPSPASQIGFASASLVQEHLCHAPYSISSSDIFAIHSPFRSVTQSLFLLTAGEPCGFDRLRKSVSRNRTLAGSDKYYTLPSRRSDCLTLAFKLLSPRCR